MTITFGSWLIPAVLTAGAFLWAWWVSDDKPSSGYGNIGKGLGNALIMLVAIAASLFVWLVWALVT